MFTLFDWIRINNENNLPWMSKSKLLFFRRWQRPPKTLQLLMVPTVFKTRIDEKLKWIARRKYCNFPKKTRIGMTAPTMFSMKIILIKIYKIDRTEHWKILNFSNKKMDWHGSHRSDGYWLFPKWFVTDKYVTELQHRQLFGWDCNMYFVYMWKCENFLHAVYLLHEWILSFQIFPWFGFQQTFLGHSYRGHRAAVILSQSSRGDFVMWYSDMSSNIF